MELGVFREITALSDFLLIDFCGVYLVSFLFIKTCKNRNVVALKCDVLHDDDLEKPAAVTLRFYLRIEALNLV